MKGFFTPQKLFLLHGWLGMNFGLLLLVVCLSGAIATLTHEIEWLFNPQLRIQAEGAVQWQKTYEALQNQFPDHQISGFGRGENIVTSNIAWEAWIEGAGARWAQVRVDPYKALVVREPHRVYLTNYFRQIHYNFHSRAGFFLVCFLSFALLFSIVSGLSFYKGWWKHLFRLKLRHGARPFWSSLHRLLGVWSLLFGMIIAVTGIWYLAEDTVVPDELAYPSSVKVPDTKLAMHGPAPALLPLENYVAVAQQAIPGLRPLGIELPVAPGDSVAVNGQAAGWFVRDRANKVSMDLFDAEVISIRNATDLNAMERWVDTADVLHFGYFGGLATKFLWAFLGLCLPALILTGAILSFRRARLLTSHQNLPHENRLRDLPRQFPLRTWLVLLVLTGAFYSSIKAYIEQRQIPPPPALPHGMAQIGVWKAELSTDSSLSPEGTLDCRVRITAENGGWPNFRRVWLWTGNESPSESQMTELHGQPHVLRGSISVPSTGASDSIWMKIEDWSGQTTTAKFPLLASQISERPENRSSKVTPTEPEDSSLLLISWSYALFSGSQKIERRSAVA
jgi:uncharacterized iron-regulated membrane protein